MSAASRLVSMRQPKGRATRVSMNGVRRFQPEWRDLDVELGPVWPRHLIGPVHRTRGGLERAPRRVFERVARRKNWRLTHHARAFDFVDMVQRVGDDPVPADELHRLGALIRDANRVLEYPCALKRLRVFR